jgi:hypothetical protein
MSEAPTHRPSRWMARLRRNSLVVIAVAVVGVIGGVATLVEDFSTIADTVGKWWPEESSPQPLTDLTAKVSSSKSAGDIFVQVRDFAKIEGLDSSRLFTCQQKQVQEFELLYVTNIGEQYLALVYADSEVGCFVVQSMTDKSQIVSVAFPPQSGHLELYGVEHHRFPAAFPSNIIEVHFKLGSGTGYFSASSTIFLLKNNLVRKRTLPIYEHYSGWGGFQTDLVEFIALNEFSAADGKVRLRRTGFARVCNYAEEEAQDSQPDTEGTVIASGGKVGSLSQTELYSVSDLWICGDVGSQVTAVKEFPEEAFDFDFTSGGLVQKTGQFVAENQSLSDLYSDLAEATGDWFTKPAEIEAVNKQLAQ